MPTVLRLISGNSFRPILILVCAVVIASSLCLADTLRVATFNALNFRGSQDNGRVPYFRTIMRAMYADVVTMEEIESQSAIDWLLTNVYQQIDTTWQAAAFAPGPDTGNALFYKSNTVRFISQRAIHTDLRDITEYIIEPAGSDSTQRLHLFAAHLKASSGTDNEEQRRVECVTLRAELDSLPENTMFMMMGDFNLYTSNEPAYQVMLSPDPSPIGQLFDPINSPGDWNNNGQFAAIHTQSTRVENLGDGGATGGLDDRFDFILVSAALMDTTDSYVLPQTYHPFGNDGQHFNQSINNGHNEAVPDSVANALYHATDHLPCTADFYVGQSPSAVHETRLPAEFQVLNCYPNPFNSSLTIEVPALNAPSAVSVFDLLGRKVDSQMLAANPGGQTMHKDFSGFASGTYFVRLESRAMTAIQKIQYIR